MSIYSKEKRANTRLRKRAINNLNMYMDIKGMVNFSCPLN